MGPVLTAIAAQAAYCGYSTCHALLFVAGQHRAAQRSALAVPLHALSLRVPLRLPPACLCRLWDEIDPQEAERMQEAMKKFGPGFLINSDGSRLPLGPEVEFKVIDFGISKLSAKIAMAAAGMEAQVGGPQPTLAGFVAYTPSSCCSQPCPAMPTYAHAHAHALSCMRVPALLVCCYHYYSFYSVLPVSHFSALCLWPCLRLRLPPFPACRRRWRHCTSGARRSPSSLEARAAYVGAAPGSAPTRLHTTCTDACFQAALRWPHVAVCPTALPAQLACLLAW